MLPRLSTTRQSTDPRPSPRSARSPSAGPPPYRGALIILTFYPATTLQLPLPVMLVRRIATRSPALRRYFSSARVSRADFTHAVSNSVALCSRRYGTIATSERKPIKSSKLNQYRLSALASSACQSPDN